MSVTPKPVRMGILSFAHMHTYSYANCILSNPACDLVGVADADMNRAEKLASQLGCSAYRSYEELLDVPTLDAVVIGSENVHHKQLTELAASAGKHILCEKPLATSIQDAEFMIETCKSNGVQLMTAFPCRFSPVMKRLKQMIDSGKSGRILAFRGTNRGSNPGGWFCNPPLSGGGATIDHTVHVTDLMRWLLKEDVSEVYAEISNGIQHQDFDDVSFISMTFPSGVFATLDASWSRPMAFPTWGDVTLEVITDRGTISMDMFSQNLVQYSNRSHNISWYNWGGNMDYGLIDSFVNSLAMGKQVEVSGLDGLKATEVALCAYQSSQTCTPIKIRSQA